MSDKLKGDANDKSLFIHLNSINGTFNAYIIAFNEEVPISSYSQPSQENFFWSMTTSGSRNLIIDESDLNYVGNGTYFIEVVCEE